MQKFSASAKKTLPVLAEQHFYNFGARIVELRFGHGKDNSRQEPRKDTKARDSKEKRLAAVEARKALNSLSKSRSATTLRELIREVTTMTKVSK